MEIVGLALGLLALVIVVFAVLLAVSWLRLRLRTRALAAPFRADVQVGGAEAVTIGEDFGTLVDARAAIVRALGDRPAVDGPRTGWVLAGDGSGGWVVADEIHSL